MPHSEPTARISVIGGSTYCMRGWSSLTCAFFLFILSFSWISDAQAQSLQTHPEVSGQIETANDPHDKHTGGGWEGSPEDTAYSEFQHHIVGLGDALFGLAELGQALQYPPLLWTRLALPTILGAIGVYNLVWSDHDAWPIGSLGFVETFFGQDREIIEHKLCAVLALAIAVCEALRRTGRVRHPAWAAPLVLLTLVGSLLLFAHSHVNHPAAARIDLHHALLGSVGICAGLSKGLASWLPGASPHVKKRWEVAWGGMRDSLWSSASRLFRIERGWVRTEFDTFLKPVLGLADHGQGGYPTHL